MTEVADFLQSALGHEPNDLALFERVLSHRLRAARVLLAQVSAFRKRRAGSAIAKQRSGRTSRNAPQLPNMPSASRADAGAAVATISAATNQNGPVLLIRPA